MAEDGKTHLTGNAAGDIYAGRVLAIAPMMDWTDVARKFLKNR